jgi:hypothetical protein
MTGVSNILAPDRLKAYRDRTFRLLPELKLRTAGNALDFVRERGFVYFWPIKGITLPSLWAAVAGDRPVADAHDDPGHVTWGWKDDLLGKRQWYYAKVLRGKATMIALDVVPYFYALSGNYGEPEKDYLQQYQDGLLSHDAKAIYEALLAEGPLDTVNLRRVIHMTSKTSDTPFERGLVELQRDFKILPTGIAPTGAWRYSFVYEAVHRHYPDLPEAARAITRRTARHKLAGLYFDSVGAATAADVRRLFQWRPDEVTAVLAELVKAGQLRAGYRVANEPEERFVTPALADIVS